MATLKVNDVTIEVAPENLPAATTSAKGAVKKGASVPKGVRIEEETTKSINDVIESLRNAGSLDNTKFRLLYVGSFPDDIEEDYEKQNIPQDDRIYEENDVATILFYDGDPYEIPYYDGYNFLGWSTTPHSRVPDYPISSWQQGQTFTVTFTDDDIILYGVWEAITHTLTYNLGSYGTGSVPASQTLLEGVSTQLAFSPVPTVNDGSGRVFVGWNNYDGANEAAWTPNNPDITIYNDTDLYPVFAYTLTYSAGSYGVGPVPSQLYGQSGDSIEIDFWPHPDPSTGNRVFCGWSYSDGMTSYTDANYTEAGQSTITLYSNETLYPVFTEQYTLYYVYGNDGTGNKPDNMEVFNNQTVWLSFSPAPTCISDPSKSFLGWATNDLQTTPEYSQDGIDYITISGDVVLYPVFGGSQSNSIFIDNSNGEYGVNLINPEDDSIIYSIGSYDTYTWNYNPGDNVRLEFASTPDNYSVNFNGTYLGNSYNDQALTIDFNYPNGCIEDPTFGATWACDPGDNGTITITSFSGTTVVEGYFTFDLSGLTDEGGAAIITNGPDTFTVSEGSSQQITIYENEQYTVFGSTNAVAIYFTGDYNMSSYTNYQLTVDQNGYLLSPDGSSYWTCAYEGDSGRIVFSPNVIAQTFDITIENYSSNDIRIWDSTKTSILQTVNYQDTYTFIGTVGTSYQIDAVQLDATATATGDYDGGSYSGTTLNYNYDSNTNTNFFENPSYPYGPLWTMRANEQISLEFTQQE